MLRKKTQQFIFLGYVLGWTVAHIYWKIHCFILSFSKDRSSIKLENIFWNITQNNSILKKCDLIPKVLPIKMWKILQLTKSDKGKRLKVQLNQALKPTLLTWDDSNWFGFIFMIAFRENAFNVKPLMCNLSLHPTSDASF